MKNVWLKMKPTHGEVLRGMYLDKLKNTEALCDPKRAFNSLHGLRRAIFHLLEICPKSNQQFANIKGNLYLKEVEILRSRVAQGTPLSPVLWYSKKMPQKMPYHSI